VASERVDRREYLEKTVRLWLGLPDRSDVEVPRLPEPLARRFLREEEYEHSYRDQWGCWEFGFSESFRDGTLVSPEIDRWAAEERRRLEGAGISLTPLWPDGKAFALCLTHDVDLVSTSSTPRQVLRSMQNSLERPRHGGLSQQLLRLARPPVRLARAARTGISLAPSATPTLERCVAMELEAGVTASYFFTVLPDRHVSRYDCLYGLNDPCTFRGERHRIVDVIRQLSDDGFDVGLHGSYHSALEPGLLATQKATLERATGLEIKTTRQHFLHWDIRTTPRLQDEAGLAADSTLGFNRSIGFRAGTSLPFHHFDLESNSMLQLIEVPLIIQDGPIFNPVALELDVELALELVHHLIDVIADAGGVATLSFHPNNLEHDDFATVYRSAIEYGLKRGGWAASVGTIQSWWRERAEKLAAA
jgi:peptidoglycan/xylan/chitin deacetylase (PgdA/CDA1 family)